MKIFFIGSNDSGQFEKEIRKTPGIYMYIYIHVPANTVALCTRNTALLRPVVDYARGSKSIPPLPSPSLLLLLSGYEKERETRVPFSVIGTMVIVPFLRFLFYFARFLLAERGI